MGFDAREVERCDNPRRASLEPRVVPGPPTEEKEGEGARDAKRARARISSLIAVLHGMDAAEDNEISNADGIPDEWLSSWYPETHESEDCD